MIGSDAKAAVDSTLTMAPARRRQQRQERLRHRVGAEQVDGQVLLDRGRVAEVVVQRRPRRC